MISLRRCVALAADRAGVLVLDLGAARLELADAEIDALEDSSGSKPVTTIGTRNSARERLVFLDSP